MVPCRILHVLGRLDRGGTETLIMNWYRCIDQSKVQFDFVIHTNEQCSYTTEIEQLGGKIYSVPQYCGKNHFDYCRAWELFFSIHPEYQLIHGHIRSTAAIYLRIAKKYGLKTIAHSHSTSSGNGFTGLVKNILQYPIRNLADYCWACSLEAGEYLYGKRVCDGSKFRVINNAIHVEAFSFVSVIREQYRKMLSLGENTVIGHVGRFTPQKNHAFLLKVFIEYHAKQPKSKLIIIGVGPLYEAFCEDVKKAGIKDDVIILRDRSDIPQLMQAMDVFLFPSLFEGLGIVAVEAQAAGLNCIASESVPRAAKATDNITFLPISQENDVSKWVSEIIRITSVARPREKQDKNIIAAGYDIKEETNKLLGYYRDILSSGE